MEGESKEDMKQKSLFIKLENVKDRLVYAGLLGESFLQEKAAVENEIKQAQKSVKENYSDHDHEKVLEIRTQLQELENSLVVEEAKLVQLLNSKSYGISSSKLNNDKVIQNAFPYDQPTRAETNTQYAATIGQNILQQLKTLHFRFKEKDIEFQKVLKENGELLSQLDSLNDKFKIYTVERSNMKTDHQALEQNAQILTEKLAHSDSMLKIHIDEKEKLATELSSLRLSFGQLQCLLSKTEDLQNGNEVESFNEDSGSKAKLGDVSDVFFESNPSFQKTLNEAENIASSTKASECSSSSSSLMSSKSSVSDVALKPIGTQDTGIEKRIDTEDSEVMDQLNLPEKGSLLNFGRRNLEELSLKLRNSSFLEDQCVHFLLTTHQFQEAVANDWSIKQIPGLSVSHNLRLSIDATGVDISKQSGQITNAGITHQQTETLPEQTGKPPSKDANEMSELKHETTVKPLVPLLIISENDQKNRIAVETLTGVRLDAPETSESIKNIYSSTNKEHSEYRREADNETAKTVRSPVSFRLGSFDTELNKDDNTNAVSIEAQKPRIQNNRSSEDNGVELASTKSTASLLSHDSNTYKKDYFLKRRSSSFSSRYPITRRSLTLYEASKDEPHNIRLNTAVPRRSLSVSKDKSIQCSINGRTVYPKTRPSRDYDWDQWSKLMSNNSVQRLSRSRSLVLPRRSFSFAQSIPEVISNSEETPYSPAIIEDTNQLRRRNYGMPSWFLKASPAPSMFSLSEKGETASSQSDNGEPYQRMASNQRKDKQVVRDSETRFTGKMGAVSVIPLRKGAKEQDKSLDFLQGISEQLAHVMIGDYIFKYKRNKFAKFFTKPMHLRYAWIHPYQERLYWSKINPFIGINKRTEIKSVKIIGFDTVSESYLEDPDVVYNRSIIVLTDEKPVKIAARSKAIHEVWLKAFRDLKIRKNATNSELLLKQNDKPRFNKLMKPNNPDK
ncbi:meiotic cortical anchoring factor for dynein Mcp5/Num1 [Schizosaccharomyces osmophilus]|uniref:Meiotic cortical anchoring factor for dynein Mcp5/Num1 n=1 Tax=Schizosaccharomyces osmophilus TaxID=2545709 RepID=A0AAE9WAC5_9SCHI|nr:meiotic cortical anchoring factor for dynein Mcp5/Num1 [Schizosaccharomyces osmophilus]WBW72599.1 meiotic cortical anchoring factor for dynein Mcp5/Num1 [Schizosaccharomyces osmophilus]